MTIHDIIKQKNKLVNKSITTSINNGSIRKETNSFCTVHRYSSGILLIEDIGAHSNYYYTDEQFYKDFKAVDYDNDIVLDLHTSVSDLQSIELNTVIILHDNSEYLGKFIKCSLHTWSINDSNFKDVVLYDLDKFEKRIIHGTDDFCSKSSIGFEEWDWSVAS